MYNITYITYISCTVHLRHVQLYHTKTFVHPESVGRGYGKTTARTTTGSKKEVSGKRNDCQQKYKLREDDCKNRQLAARNVGN